MPPPMFFANSAAAMMIPSLFPPKPPPKEDWRVLRTCGRDIARMEPKSVPSEAMVKDARSGPKDDGVDTAPPPALSTSSFPCSCSPPPRGCFRRRNPLVPPKSSNGVANVSDIP